MTTNHVAIIRDACCTLQHSISLLTNFDKTSDASDKNVGTIILRVFTPIADFVAHTLDLNGRRVYP